MKRWFGKKKSTNRTYVIGSGWYSNASAEHSGSLQPHCRSSKRCRQPEFHHLWYHFINKYTSPRKIIIVDSDSEIPPPINTQDSRIELLRLDKNYGHAVDAQKCLSMSGWERAVIMGALYAHLCESDYLYVEQDCLVRGFGWVEACYRAFKRGKIMVGNGEGTPQPIQQSLFFVANEFIPTFVSTLLDPSKGGVRRFQNPPSKQQDCPEVRWYEAFQKQMDFLPFGDGRKRPLVIEQEHFYAQQWTDQELETFCKSEHLDISQNHPWEHLRTLESVR